MTTPNPAPTLPSSPRERLEARLRKILSGRDTKKLRGPDTEQAVWLILTDADEYAAWMAEKVARPDERWGPK